MNPDYFNELCICGHTGHAHIEITPGLGIQSCSTCNCPDFWQRHKPIVTQFEYTKTSRLKDWLTNEALVLGIICVIFAAFLCLVAYFVTQDDRAWKQFAERHHCHIIAEEDGTISNNSYISGKTGFQCDDGITYWKSR